VIFSSLFQKIASLSPVNALYAAASIFPPAANADTVNLILRRTSMKNVKLSVEGTKLMIEVDLSQDFGKSASGKSLVIASTEGNKSVPGTDEIKIGLNIYRPNK
jgi:hypothetical protein